jgi:transposase
MVAGGPLANDVIKCRLKPLDRGAYRASFTDQQWARLQAAFPTGVCDFTQPAAERTAPISWPSFAGGPGGAPLGPAPRSAP